MTMNDFYVECSTFLDSYTKALHESEHFKVAILESEFKVKYAEAKADQRIRAQAQSNNEKVTEGVVESRVVIDPDVQLARQALVDIRRKMIDASVRVRVIEFERDLFASVSQAASVK